MISWFRRQEWAAQGSQGRRADPGKGAWYDRATAVQAQSNPDILCQHWGAKPCALEPQVLPGSALGVSAPSGCQSKGSCVQGHRAGRGFLSQPLHDPESMAEPSQAGQTRCLLSLIAALCLSQSGSWLLPLHRIVSSHSRAPTGLTAFPLRLAAQLSLTSSLLPLTSQRHLLSLPPPIHSDFPFFSHHLTVLPCIIFCTEVQKAVGLHCGDTKVGCLLERLPSIPFTLSLLQRSRLCLHPGGDERAQSPAGQWQHCAAESSCVWLPPRSSSAEHRAREGCPSAPLHAPHWAKSGRRWRD